MTTRLPGVSLPFEGDASSLKSAGSEAIDVLKSVADAADGATVDMKALGPAIDDAGGALEAAGAQGNVAAKGFIDADKSAQAFADGLARAAAAAGSAENAIDDLGDEAKKAGATVKRAASDLDGYSSSASKVGKSTESLASKSKAAAGPIGAVGGAASATAGSLGGLSGAAGGAVSAAGNLATAFAEAGPLGLAVVAATLAFSALYDEFEEIERIEKEVEASTNAVAATLQASFEAINASTKSQITAATDSIKALNEQMEFLGDAEAINASRLTEQFDVATAKIDSTGKVLETITPQLKAVNKELALFESFSKNESRIEGLRAQRDTLQATQTELKIRKDLASSLADSLDTQRQKTAEANALRDAFADQLAEVQRAEDAEKRRLSEVQARIKANKAAEEARLKAVEAVRKAEDASFSSSVAQIVALEQAIRDAGGEPIEFPIVLDPTEASAAVGKLDFQLFNLKDAARIELEIEAGEESFATFKDLEKQFDDIAGQVVDLGGTVDDISFDKLFSDPETAKKALDEVTTRLENTKKIQDEITAAVEETNQARLDSIAAAETAANSAVGFVGGLATDETANLGKAANLAGAAVTGVAGAFSGNPQAILDAALQAMGVLLEGSEVFADIAADLDEGIGFVLEILTNEVNELLTPFRDLLEAVEPLTSAFGDGENVGIIRALFPSIGLLTDSVKLLTPTIKIVAEALSNSLIPLEKFGISLAPPIDGLAIMAEGLAFVVDVLIGFQEIGAAVRDKFLEFVLGLDFVQNGLEFLGRGFQGLTSAVEQTIEGIVNAASVIGIDVEAILGAINGGADADGLINGISGALGLGDVRQDDVVSISEPIADAVDSVSDALLGVANDALVEATNDNTEAVQSLSESLKNLPDLFNIQQERLRAAAGGGGGNFAGPNTQTGQLARLDTFRTSQRGRPGGESAADFFLNQNKLLRQI